MAEFDQIAKNKLAFSNLLHADETGVNIGGKRHWLHIAPVINHGLTISRIKNEEWKPWMKLTLFLALKEFYVMTIGNRTTIMMVACTLYAMPII